MSPPRNRPNAPGDNKTVNRFCPWPWLAAVLSGLLLTLCFPRADQGWLGWVALTPLASAVLFGKGGIKRAALLGYLAGLVFFWGVFSWLSCVTVVGWLVLPFYLASLVG